MTIEDSSGTTLHQRILNDIEGRIISGAWPPGYRLPFEVDLAVQYGCSRMTVNKVMTQLAKSGLIERRKKSGTFVAHPQAQSAVLEIHDIREEVQSLNLSYGYRLLSRTCRKAGTEDLRRLGVSKATQLVDLTCIHLAGDRPFCLEKRLIDLAVVPEAKGFDFETIAPGPWLLAQIPWTTAEHRIQAVRAGAEETEHLQLSPNDPCLVIERQTWSHAGPVTNVRLTYPGDRHRLVAQFKPNS
uniref:Histidine utilization repressor n=1 Tax=Chelativorans sp. (strain BNC1) TaxID=266779 RepID=Q11E15_CHESB